MSNPKRREPEQQQPEQQQSTAVAVIPTTDEQTALAAWSQTGMPCVTSLPMQSDNGMSQAIAAMGSATHRGRDMVKRDLRVTHWLVHRVNPIVGEDGQEGGSMRLVLILEDGETIATRAPAVLDRWRMIVSAARLMKWKWPITIQLANHPVGKGREYLEITSHRPS